MKPKKYTDSAGTLAAQYLLLIPVVNPNQVCIWFSNDKTLEIYNNKATGMACDQGAG